MLFQSFYALLDFRQGKANQHIPTVCMFGHDTQQFFLARPTNPQLGRLLYGLGGERRIVEMIVFTPKTRPFMGPQLSNDLDGFSQLGESGAD